jgi:HEAT repeat protein
MKTLTPRLLISTLLTAYFLFNASTVVGAEHRKTREEIQKETEAAIAVKQAQDILMKLAELKHNIYGQNDPDAAIKNRREREEREAAKQSAIAQLELLGTDIAPVLAQNLNSSSQDVGFVCSQVLTKIGKPAIKPILKAMDERGELIYARAIFPAMGNLAVPTLIETLKSGDRGQQQAAATALNYMTFPTGPIDLNHRMIRPNTLFYTDNRVTLSTEDLAVICQALSNQPSEITRQNLAALLGKAGVKQKIVSDTLSNIVLNDPVPQVRVMALVAFNNLVGAPDNSAVLCQILSHDSSEACRAMAANALGLKNSGDEIRVAALISALGDKNEEVVVAAINSLGNLGLQAKSALPALKKLVQENKTPAMLPFAITAISQLGDDESISLVASYVDDSDTSLKIVAVRALANYKDKAAPMFDKLIPLLKSENYALRLAVVQTVGSMGEKGKPAASALRLDVEKNPQDKGVVENALRRMGEPLTAK